MQDRVEVLLDIIAVLNIIGGPGGYYGRIKHYCCWIK